MQKATSKKAQPKSPAAGAKRKLTCAEKKQIAEVIQNAKGDGKPYTAQQTMLFFMERDNDTFKNLRTIPVNDGSVWDFSYLIEQVIKNNMSMIFPMCISLIAGYMISREQTDDTLKNILTVPISFKRLLTGKLIVCGVLSIIFGLICSLFTIIAELLVGFPGFRVTLALKSILQITAVNFFLYLAVLPIIVITCRKAGSFLVGVIIAFVYGYGGMFAAGNMTLANIYPITASLGMVGYRNYDTAVHWNIIACMCSLAFVVIISAVFILCTKETEPQKVKKKAKKVIAKKGW